MDDSMVFAELTPQRSFYTEGGPTDLNTPDNNLPYRRILGVICLSLVWTLLLTAIPFAVDVGPNNYYPDHDKWYTGNDLMRFLEPIGGLFFNIAVLYQSGIIHRPLDNANFTCMFVFLLGLVAYQQGAAFHSASNMFKNALETVTDTTNDDRYHDLYVYMRTFWEHLISHYIYATGFAAMQVSITWAYKDHQAPLLGLTLQSKAILVVAAVANALLLVSVSINFPSGTIVGFVFLFGYGVLGLGAYLLWKRQYGKESMALRFGQRPVVHLFLLSYVIALVLLIAWIIDAGGFYSLKEQGSDM